MKQTKTYGLGSFEAGDFYNPEEDRRRFVTLDYHFDTYIGIIGNGVITGWDVVQVAGTLVKVTPGAGFISGLYSESPYAINATTSEPLRQSEAESLGYDIGEEIPGWSSAVGSFNGAFYKEGGSPDEDAQVFKSLGPDGEDSNYDGIVDGVLQPSYQTPPTSYFLDPYVKSYIPAQTEFMLDNNSDTYIFAERTGSSPTETFVKFVASKSFILNSKRTLLAKVTTRAGAVSKVDVSSSFRLSGMSGAIANIGKDLVKGHVHGGSKPSDPPKIKLKTDIRSSLPLKKVNGAITYSIVPNKTTGATLNHRHTYSANANGEGYTMSVIGAYEFHYHRIAGFAVTETRGNYGSITVENHVHTIPGDDSSLDQGGVYKVYINGKEAAPEDYAINAGAATITFVPGKVNWTLPVYSCTFQIRGKGSDTTPRTYAYKLETMSVEKFLTGMWLDFYNTYKEEINGVPITSTTTNVQVWNEGTQQYDTVPVTSTDAPEGGYLLRSPFDFFYLSDDGRSVEIGEDGVIHVQDYVPVSESLSGSTALTTATYTGAAGTGLSSISDEANVNQYGIDDFGPMAAMAASVLKKAGDEFILLPNVAKYITMKLDRQGYSDEVTIEILNNVEVTGVLQQDNIYFVMAEKFIEGVFDQARIPFLNHIGRMGEPLYAQQTGTVTKDGVEFVPAAYRTDTALGHSHRVYVDANGNGVTLATLINNQIAVWEYDPNGKAVRVTHSHSITKNVSSGTVSPGINAWSSVDSATSHFHSVDEIVHGAARSVFSVASDNQENLWMSSSDGVWVLSSGNSYLVSIGENKYYDYGVSIESALRSAGARYANDTGASANIDSSILSQAATATNTLSQVGNIYSFGGTPQISMMSVQCAKIDSLYIDTTKEEKDIETGEVKIRDITKKPPAMIIAGTEIPPESGPTVFLVRRYYDDKSFWHVDINEDTVTLVSHNSVLIGSHHKGWNEVRVPSASGNTRKSVSAQMVKEAGVPGSSSSSSSSSFSQNQEYQKEIAYIMASCEMVAVSRTGGTSYSAMAGLDGRDCFDVVCIDGTWFLVATDLGVYRVDGDGNGVESPTLSKEIYGLAIDYGNPGGMKAYGLSAQGVIFSSEDGGQTWTEVGSVPVSMGEVGRMMPAFGRLLIATEKGLVTMDSSEPVIVMKDVLYCMGWHHDGSKAYFGGAGCAYETSDGVEFIKIAAFDGIPFPAFYVAGSRKIFGYAHNYIGGICFERPPASTDKVTAVMSFDKWVASGKGWDPTTANEIFIDGTKVYSSKYGIDLRGVACDMFVEYPQSGLIDFSSSVSLTAPALKGDVRVFVDGSLAFSGKKSVILTDADGKIYSVAISASNGVVTLGERLERDVGIQATLRILSSMTAANEVKGNFFSSNLFNIGTLSHYEIEDGLSDASIGLPMRIGETYVGNLSALTMGTKRAIDEVDSKMKNWKAYGMEYSLDPAAPNYVGNDFDIQSTLANIQSTFGNESGQRMATAIRCIVVGNGNYNGIVFAGTDAGLFYIKADDRMERPWIPVMDCPVADVYGAVVAGGCLLVVGVGGIYQSKAGETTGWLQVDALADGGSIPAFMTLRFAGNAGTRWWNSWDGSFNTLDGDITNTIVVGGNNFLVISQDNGSTWAEVSIPASSSYVADTLMSVSDGTALLGTSGISGESSSILYDSGAGNSWSAIASFPGVKGTIASSSQSLGGNTEITVAYAAAEPAMKDNALAGLTAIIGNSAREVAGNGDGHITLLGSFPVNVGAPIVIDPLKVNAFAESGGTILVGTSLGMLTDNGTYMAVGSRGGIINELDKKAVVSAIDVGGEINGIQASVGSTSLICTLDKSVKSGEMVGKQVVFAQTTTPSVSILAPLPGNSIPSTSVTVVTSTTLFDPGASGYVKITIDSASPVYSTSNTTVLSGVPIGSHRLKVVLTDLSKAEYGNATASKMLDLSTVASGSSPSISVSFPAVNQVVKTSSFNITGTVANFDATGVDGTLTYSLDGSTVVTVVMGSNGSFSIPVSNMGDGAHSTRLTLVGTSGVSTGTYVDIPFTVQLTSEPTLITTYPTNGTVLVQSSVTITYVITNFTVPSQGLVKATVDGTTSITSSSPTSIALTNLADGAHVIALELVDSSLAPINSHYGAASISLTVAASTAQNPRVVILAPATGEQFAEGTTQVGITYDTANFLIPSDGGVVVAFGGVETFVTAPSPYQLPISANGQYTVTLTLATSATNKLSNAEATASITFYVGPVSAVPQAVTTASASTTTPTITATTTTTTSVTVSTTAATTASTTATSTASSTASGMVIVSNGSSAANGETVIVVSSVISKENTGRPFKVVGNQSTIYFSTDYQIVAGEFAGGTMYIDSSERNNGGKKYAVDNNSATSVTLTTAIVPSRPPTDTSSPDVYEGEVVRLVGKNGTGEAWVSYDTHWNKNELAGETIAIDHANGSRSYGVIQANTSRTMEVSGIDRSQFMPGDAFTVMNAVFGDVPSFAMVKTTTNEDHYHGTTLIGKMISGKIVSANLLSSSRAEIIVADQSGLDDPLILADPTVLRGSKIMFYSQDGSEAYEETIDLVYQNSIIVTVSNAADWNLNGTSSRGIDVTYGWESDAKACGKTVGTTYVGLITYTTGISKDVVNGSTTVWIDAPAAFVPGDVVELFDSTHSVQRTSVISVTDHLVIADPAEKTFAKAWGASIRIRKNTFDGDHEHQIRNGEIYSVTVPRFQSVGYPASHSHILSSMIQGITCMKTDGNGKIYAGGTSNIVLSGLDNGNSWKAEVDLNLEGGDSCQMATCIELDKSGFAYVGTGCGFVVVQTDNTDKGAGPIDIPVIDESSSSSSASSSSSSSSRSSGSSASSASSISSKSSVSSGSSVSSMSSPSSSSSSSESSVSSESSSSSSISSVSSASSNP